MRRAHLLFLVVVATLALAGAFLQVAGAQTPAPPPPTDACKVGLTKVIDPTDILLGETAKVTMVMTHTCPSVAPPMDLMFLVDVSNSMTKGDQSRITDPCGPDPSTDPLPTKDIPPSTPGSGPPTKEPTLPSGVEEPTACPTRPGALPITTSRPPSTDPTAAITKEPPPGPGTPDPTLEPPTPGSVVGPTRSAIIDTRPREDPGTEDLIREAAEFVRNFTTEPVVRQAATDGRLRVALVAFESRPHTISGLTSKLTRITSGVGRLENLPHGTTNVAMGFFRANQLMDRGLDASRGANRVIVLISDGKFDTRTIRGLRKREGIVHLGVAMGKAPDLNQMSNIVTERRYLLTPKDYQTFYDLYIGELSLPRKVTMVRALVHDELESNIRYVSGSAWPTATVTGQVIEWLFEPPSSPITMTYEIEPLEGGTWPVSREAKVDWTDTIGRSGSQPFPPVQVVVHAPTSTPTATATRTPTPTVTPTLEPGVTPTRKPPEDLYLPVLMRQPKPKPCIPSEQTVDVAIVIDTSDSMLEESGSGRSKMSAAVESGRVLASLLKLGAGGDQATVIGFNHVAYLMTPLSPDAATVRAALDALPGTQATGTKIDAAILMAGDQLTGPGRRTGNTAAMVLLTDGRHEGNAADVTAAANQLKAAGIFIHTVGLGSDVDAALLQSIASDPSFYYWSPTGEGLEDIYRRIAEVVACP